MAKFRSKTNYAQVYASDKQGYNLGLDASIYLRQESIPRTFQAPRIGTQGSSVSASTPSLDISAETDTNFRLAVSGKAPVTVTLTPAGKTTGTLIAAEIELKSNVALAAAGYDERVWCEFAGGLYKIWHQGTGVSSTVVVTAGLTANIADTLKLGLANSGIETAGTDDQDFLLYTTGGVTFSQPIESNAHRSGRYHTGIIKQKKVTEFDFDTYVNMSGTAGASIDNAVALLFEAALGKKTVNSGVSVDFEQDLPVIYMSAVRVSTIFGEYITGMYVRELNLTFPGDGPATVKYTGKAEKTEIAGIAKVNGAVSASTDVILESGESERYTAGAYVMAVDTDGRTILAGADGTLKIDSVDDALHKLVLSAAVTLADNTFIVPWDPGAAQQTGRDAIFTDLVGSFKLDSTAAAVDVTEITLSINNDHVDLDNRFGADANKGYVAGNRMTATLGVTFDLSNETYGKVVRTRDFGGFNPEIVLGSTSGRHLKVTAPNWIPSVPTIEVPDSGTTPITLEGVLYQSAPGAKDPIKISFR